MDKKIKLALKVLGLNAILLIYISNRPASDITQHEDIWMKDFKRASNKARAENKLILLYFSGSDWCKPCIRFSREVFDQEEFISYARENLVLLKLDFPRYKKNRLPKEQVKHNEALAARFNQEGSFPLVLIMDKDENVLMKTGYTDGGVSEFMVNVKEKMAAF